MEYKNLIIGEGEIGKGLYKVILTTGQNVIIKDKEFVEFENKEILHICFPYGRCFVSEVERYIRVYKPKLVIIHSTVKVGTTRERRVVRHGSS